MKRDKQLKIRVTEDEYRLIKSIANDRGLTLTKFLITVALDNELPAPPNRVTVTEKVVEKVYVSPPPYDPGLVYEVSKIGTNLNQIARKVNQGFDDPIELLVQLKVIEEQIGEVLK